MKEKIDFKELQKRMQDLQIELQKLDNEYKKKVRALSEACSEYLEQKKNLHKLLFELERTQDQAGNPEDFPA